MAIRRQGRDDPAFSLGYDIHLSVRRTLFATMSPFCQKRRRDPLIIGGYPLPLEMVAQVLIKSTAKIKSNKQPRIAGTIKTSL